MIRSMTGFASAKGERGVHRWVWELRSVNGKGLDIRLRVPDWLEGLEPALRAELSKSVARGNVSLSLKLTREDDAASVALNEPAMAVALDALARCEAAARVLGLDLAPTSAGQVLALRGMLDGDGGKDDPAPLVAQMKDEFAQLVTAFVGMRETEGAALAGVLTGQLDQISELAETAAALAEARKDAMAETLRSNLARVLENADGVDEARVTQELALIAVRADVTEEIDRLRAHVAAARDLIAAGSPVGRKLDFLMQEFNREANTLCSKSQSTHLTAAGLELKTVIDQMREQVQNVE